MGNTVYDNFFLSNEIEDQYKSHLDLVQFCTVDNNLTGEAGMIRKIHKYKATSGTEKLAKGEGNSKTITAAYTEQEYKILLAQKQEALHAGIRELQDSVAYIDWKQNFYDEVLSGKRPYESNLIRVEK